MRGTLEPLKKVVWYTFNILPQEILTDEATVNTIAFLTNYCLMHLINTCNICEHVSVQYQMFKFPAQVMGCLR